jgi:hypothetical protein
MKDRDGCSVQHFWLFYYVDMYHIIIKTSSFRRLLLILRAALHFPIDTWS